MNGYKYVNLSRSLLHLLNEKSMRISNFLPILYLFSIALCILIMNNITVIKQDTELFKNLF